MSVEKRNQWKIAVGVAVVAGLLVGFGCAGAKVSTQHRAVTDAQIMRPSTIVVYDFAVNPGDVIADTFGMEFSSGPGTADERNTLGYETADALSTKLVTELLNRGIRAMRAIPGQPFPPNALVVKGQFVTINEGDRAKRLTIGFGAGTSHLVARVQVFQAVEWGLRRVAIIEAEAHGSKMPGMAVPLAAGAAAGSAAISVVVSGGMNIVKEKRGGMDADASHMAEEIAERAKAFYERQGWL